VKRGDFAVLLIELNAVAATFVVQVAAFAGLLLEQVLQVFKLLAGVSNFVGGAVQTTTAIMFGAKLVIRKHAVTIFH